MSWIVTIFMFKNINNYVKNDEIKWAGFYFYFFENYAVRFKTEK